jgi:hypothetical protein
MATKMDKVLDQTLPTNLRDVVRFEGTDQSQETVASSDDTLEESIMTDKEMQAQIKADAKIEAQKLLAAEQSTVAVADRLTEMASGNHALTVQVETAEAATAAVQVTLDETIAERDALTATVEERDAALVTKDTELAETVKAHKALEADLATATEKLDAIEAEKTVAARTAALDEAGLNTEDRLARLTARTEDGAFAVPDEAFTQIVADLQAAYDAGKATAAEKPAETEGEPEQTTASEEEGEEEPTEDPTSTAVIAQRAVASLTDGSAVTTTVDGVSTYAEQFGAK